MNLLQNSGAALWQKSKKMIPTGNQLLSKRSERFLPQFWPSYYRKAKGCEIWDLDGNHYYDFAQMGVGSCTLGYADEDVNKAVIAAINDGAMSSLNSYEEVQLTELLVDLHPWSDMARYARTGGEACSIAVRIGRAASGKDKVAFCGYHGWHDWYISSNIGDDGNLDDQLLPGLKPNGIPKVMRNTTLPFAYNKLSELQKLVELHPNEIGVIIMEPQRSEKPDLEFIKGVRDIATKIGAVLIFDEVTSGFRINHGGIHLTYGVNPDIAVFGKALGNGHPISAIIGKREVMTAAETSFISSTFWTERVGFVAALATLNKMEKHDVQSDLVHHGKRINAGWRQLAADNGIPIHVSGIEPLTHIGFSLPDPLKYQTYYTQELLKKGYLLGASVYTTYAYTDKIVDDFISASKPVFETIKIAIDQDNIDDLLEGPVIESGFKRLN